MAKQFNLSPMEKHSLRYSRVPGEFAVCRLAGDSAIPGWALRGELFSVTRTADELSIVCPADQVPDDVKFEGGWACFKLEGPFPFALTGILSSFIAPLAEAKIPIFAISTFDTDYVLVKEEMVEAAIGALRKAGHGK